MRRRPRRRSRWRTAFFALAGLAIVSAGGWTLLGGKLLVVRSITVTGTHLVSPAAVIAAAGVSLGTPLLNVDAGAVTRRVEAIRQVASATVTEDWPDHLAIAVTERVPVLAVRMAAGGYDLVDPAGVIVLWSAARPAELPLLDTQLPGSALRGDPAVAAAAAVLREMPAALGPSVDEVQVAQVLTGSGSTVVQSQRVTLLLRGGRTVVWGDPANAAEKAREVRILLTGSARYIDVSAPGTVVVK